MASKVGTFRALSRRRRTDGVRVLAVRSKPRGLSNKEAKRYFDAWVPLLAPSQSLIRWLNRPTAKPGDWRKFVARYKKQMKAPQSRDLINMLAKISKQTPLSIGCHCADETRCHRTVLKELIGRAAKSR